MGGIQKRSRKLEGIDLMLPLACFVVYCLWSATLPIDLAPDEYMRLPIPYFILNHGYLPNGDEPEILNAIWGTSYAFVPYGSSLLSVLFMKLMSLVTQSESALVWAARMGSVVPATGTVLVCERIGKGLFKRRLSPYLFACICGLLPQAVFCSSYLNNEALMVFATALIVDAWMTGMEEIWSWKALIYLGVALGICALSYYFAYGYILASIGVYFLTALRQVKQGMMEKRRVLVGALAVLLVALAVGGWFFVRNYLIHDGDIFGMNASARTAEINAQDGFKPSERTMPKKEGYGYLETATLVYKEHLWWKWTLLSSIGVFGYMSITLDTSIYLAYLAFAALGLVFSVCFIATSDFDVRLLMSVFLVLCIFSLAMSLYFSWSNDFQPQGRYLASGLIPFAAFVAGGYDWLSTWLVMRTRGEAGVTRHGHEGKHYAALSEKGSWAEMIPGILLVCYALLFVSVALTVIIPLCTQGIMWSVA